jgi:hypothetical protein
MRFSLYNLTSRCALHLLKSDAAGLLRRACIICLEVMPLLHSISIFCQDPMCKHRTILCMLIMQHFFLVCMGGNAMLPLNDECHVRHQPFWNAMATIAWNMKVDGYTPVSGCPAPPWLPYPSLAHGGSFKGLPDGADACRSLPRIHP